jgi:NAD-dependent dihydropyrimidine dehydrogenase PreA subunit
MEPPMTYVIPEPCIDVRDKACIEECAAERICEGERMLSIRPDDCVGEGACEPVRAVEAIFCEDDVPGQWAQLTVGNAKFFDQLGSPGGAAKTGPLPYDTEYVANCVVEQQPVVSWPGCGEAATRTLTQRPIPRQRKRPRRPPCEQDPARRLRAYAEPCPARAAQPGNR